MNSDQLLAATVTQTSRMEAWLGKVHAEDCVEIMDKMPVDSIGGYVNRCVNDIRRRPSQPLIQWRFHPHTVHRGRRLRSTQGPSDA